MVKLDKNLHSKRIKHCTDGILRARVGAPESWTGLLDNTRDYHKLFDILTLIFLSHNDDSTWILLHVTDNMLRHQVGSGIVQFGHLNVVFITEIQKLCSH